MTIGNESSLGRGAVLIIVAGVALGLAHNWVGLTSRPPRGIHWRATAAALPDVESLTAPGGGARDTAGGANPTSDAVTPADAAPGTRPPAAGDRAAPSVPGATGQPAPASAASPARTAGHVPVLLRDRRPDAGSPASPTALPPAGGSAPITVSRPMGPLPFIPETDQPVQVKLALVKRFFDAGAALFIDARDPAEFEAGHIPGALRMTQADAAADPERVKALPARGRPIIVYCEGGTCEASLDVARVLVEAGFRKVLVFMGGFPEWAAAGHPVERGGGRS